MEQLLQAVSEMLAYNKDTGVFTWKKHRGGKAKAGMVAGCKTRNGYVVISIYNKPYYAHILAYLICYNKLPEDKVDHINQDKSDNRLCNLRPANSVLNAANNSSRGTHLSRNGWVAGITINGKRKHLGYFETEEQAQIAYKKAKDARIDYLSKRFGG